MNNVYYSVEFAFIGNDDKEPEFGMACAFPSQIITGSNGEEWPEDQQIDLGYLQARSRALEELRGLNMMNRAGLVRIVEKSDGLFKGRKAPDFMVSMNEKEQSDDEQLTWLVSDKAREDNLY
ncbi:MAG: hypothetical protein Unbinned3459contig1002_16 [Prokaryotic dsDNA virus sp.]|jgi:hypothetical protein|nr:MAG: hypothetical protein Unbinned3459contig1002_16 [Prokaryotic dsDNA virus sp.]|tara:strand:- start:442 stop:807 length:366 start_codon:yes stop_codon:yes gene_type:complete